MTAHNPALTIVSPGLTTPPTPPRPLGKEGQKLWDDIHQAFVLEDRPALELLALACENLDVAQSLKVHIQRDGEMLRLRNGTVKVNPAVRLQITCRGMVVKYLQKLGLIFSNIQTVGRPSHGGLGVDWTKDD